MKNWFATIHVVAALALGVGTTNSDIANFPAPVHGVVGYPDHKSYCVVYCGDPFRNILELYSHSYELTYLAGTYV